MVGILRVLTSGVVVVAGNIGASARDKNSLPVVNVPHFAGWLPTEGMCRVDTSRVRFTPLTFDS